MIEYILALTGKMKWSTDRIRSAISGQQTSLILSIFKKGTPTQREIALHLLSNQKINHQRLLKRLMQIVESDYLVQAKLAMKILLKNEAYHPGLQNSIRKAEKILEERTRRTNNKKLTAISFHSEPYKGVLFDKSKMKNLEKVREQLKKGMRWH